jgi:hypothetical protein
VIPTLFRVEGTERQAPVETLDKMLFCRAFGDLRTRLADRRLGNARV